MTAKTVHLERASNKWKRKNNTGRKYLPAFSDTELLELIEKAFEDKPTCETLTIKDIFREAGIEPNLSVANDIRRVLINNGYQELRRNPRNHYAKPQEAKP